MVTKAIFNVDKKLKTAAMRKARKQGLTYSSVLNFATRAYVNDQLKIEVLGEMIEKAKKDFLAHSQALK